VGFFITGINGVILDQTVFGLLTVGLISGDYCICFSMTLSSKYAHKTLTEG